MSDRAIREHLATVAQSVGVRCSGYMRDQVNPPEAMVDYEVGGHATFGAGGAYDKTWHVMVFDRRAAAEDAQKRFDVLRDPLDSASLWRAIEDHDYGTDAHYATVTNASQVQAVKVGTGDYLMVDFTIEVMT